METGLEGKPWYFGLAIGLAVTLIASALYHFKLSEGQRTRIARAESRKADLEQKIAEGLAAQKKLPQFREQVRLLEVELDKLLKILPPRRNTQELIRRFRVLTEQAGFNLRVFDPAERLVDREFFKVWDIKVDLSGGYHELALFFDRVSRLSRIINIDDLSITANRNQSTYSLTARFKAKTFVYKEPEPEPPPSPARSRRGGRGR